MRLLAVGYAGEGNAGDDLLVSRLANVVSSALPGSQLTTAWGDRSPWRPPNMSTVGRSLPEVLDAVRRVDALVIGPGGVLHNARGYESRHRDRGLAYYDTIVAEAASCNIPITAVGVGIGPLTGSAARRFCRRILERCATISVRDQHSRQLARSLGISHVETVHDLVIGWPPRAESLPPPDDTTLGICLRPCRNAAATQRIAKTVASAIDSLVRSERVTRVVGLPMSSSPIDALDDRWPTSRTLDFITAPVDRTILSIRDLDELRDALARVDVMLSMRLHGVILARNAGTPSVGIEYDDKVRTATLGLGAEIVSVRDDAETIADRVRNAVARGRSVPDACSFDVIADQLIGLQTAETRRAPTTSSIRRQIESLMLAAGT